jgi:ABC-type nitrate/sulfonate/bicarbonate transport system substrate-binding protein
MLHLVGRTLTTEEDGGGVRARRVRRGRVAGAAAALAVAVVAAACGSSGSRPTAHPTASAASGAHAAPIPVNVEIYEGSYYTWLAYLAEAQGFFAKNGLDAHVVGVTGGGPVAFAALASGTGDVAMGDLTLAGPFLEKGVGLTAIAGAVKAGWELVAASGVSLPTAYPASVRALAGKAVGVVSLGSSSYYYMRGLVTAAGLPPDAVTYAALGGVPANFVSALDADRVEVATVSPDLAYYLVELTHHQLVFNFNEPGSLAKLGPAFAAQVGKSDGLYFARNGWISAHRDGVRRFQLALEETDVWMHNPANLNQVIADLEAQQQLPAFARGPEARPYFEYVLPDLISYMPAGSAQVFQRFWTTEGVLTSAMPPPSHWVSPTIPSSAAEVVDAVRRAGEASLGDSA